MTQHGQMREAGPMTGREPQSSTEAGAPAEAGAADHDAPTVRTRRAGAGADSWWAPQHRDGMALVLSSGVSSAIGMLFWVLAARLFDQATLGVNSAALSAVTLLASASHLNMGNALLRFVPVAERRAPRTPSAWGGVRWSGSGSGSARTSGRRISSRRSGTPQ
jgi:hypothetical protein